MVSGAGDLHKRARWAGRIASPHAQKPNAAQQPRITCTAGAHSASPSASTAFCADATSSLHGAVMPMSDTGALSRLSPCRSGRQCQDESELVRVLVSIEQPAAAGAAHGRQHRSHVWACSSGCLRVSMAPCSQRQGMQGLAERRLRAFSASTCSWRSSSHSPAARASARLTAPSKYGSPLAQRPPTLGMATCAQQVQGLCFGSPKQQGSPLAPRPPTLGVAPCAAWLSMHLAPVLPTSCVSSTSH